MADTLIITKRDAQTIWMAALSGTHATDLRIASASDESTSLVGNIYIGKVRKVQKNIDAAFIEIADSSAILILPQTRMPSIQKKAIQKKSQKEMNCSFK